MPPIIDSDWFLIERAGVNYKVSAYDVKQWCAIIIHISADTQNVVTATLFGTDWSSTTRPKILIVDPGVYVGSLDTTIPAMLVSTGLTGAFTLVNNGYIYGAGGTINGGNGGDALTIRALTKLDNLGTIASGGGGGGQGGVGGQGGSGGVPQQNFGGYGCGTCGLPYDCDPCCRSNKGCGPRCGCSSGCNYGPCGAPQPNAQCGNCSIPGTSVAGGAGGTAGDGGQGAGYNQPATSGSAGGAGGPSNGNGSGAGGPGGAGGQGGFLGIPGTDGISGTPGANGTVTAGAPGTAGNPGGIAGYAIDGNAFVDYSTTGTILGPKKE